MKWNVNSLITVQYWSFGYTSMMALINGMIYGVKY